ncbi:hypothetical protein [Rubritalea tangerina]
MRLVSSSTDPNLSNPFLICPRIYAHSPSRLTPSTPVSAPNR